MRTPICDFLGNYARSDSVRLHMPGHKGVGEVEKYDLTEIFGADSLFEADGIIRESEENAGALFGADTYYSTEGSSLSIRAMLYLATLYAKSESREPLILAARNAHKSFVSAAALIGFEVEWLYSREGGYLACPVTPDELEEKINSMKKKPSAVYITSPDYLGNTADIMGLSEVCKRYGALLLVDNAHGAYLKFTTPPMHPIDLGADMCADSAHKTLHALTGASYLHISKSAPAFFREKAKSAMSLFASTSPSYLILASLDALNSTLEANFGARLTIKLCKIAETKAKIASYGYRVLPTEPMKITVSAKEYGYTGEALARLLSERGIVCEFCDKDYLVLMPSADTADIELEKLAEALRAIPRLAPVLSPAPTSLKPEGVLSPREAIFSPAEKIRAKDALGRVLAAVTVGCPPAVPILVSGERIDESAIKAFEYYGIKEISVIK